MTRAITNPEKALIRSPGDFSALYLGVFFPHTIYTARLASLPSSNDEVAQISFNTGSGTLANVKPDMTLWVSAVGYGKYDLGMARIRKAPIAGTFYIGEQSGIAWSSACYLTVMDDFDLKAKHVRMSGSTPYMDYDVAYSDQHENFKPVPVIGGHAVAELTGATVDVQIGAESGTASWVIDSSITSLTWDVPNSVSIDDANAINPIVTFNAAGWYPCYCTVLADNGASKVGVRYVYIWDQAHPPLTVFQLKDCSEDYPSGGMSFTVTLQDQADISEIQDRALCILFGVHRYGNYKNSMVESIGPMTSDQNKVIAVGRIAKESMRFDHEAGEVEFTVQGYHFWFEKIKGFPDGLRFKTGKAAAWTDMPALTVDRMIWHLLEWRSTATTMMDVILTGDPRYASELSSPAQNLMAQMQEMAFTSILANVHIDSFGRFYMEIDPQITPDVDRTWPTVTTLTKQDIQGEIEFERVTVPDIAQVDLSGVAVNSSGKGKSYFSLAPGHVFDDYGETDVRDYLLLADQSQSNQLAGLFLGWQQNEYPSVSITLSGWNPLITCFPNQFVRLAIDTTDTPRGVSFDSNFIPRRRSLSYDAKSGVIEVKLDLEAETFQKQAITGDTPPSGTDGFPPLPPLPPLPPIPVIVPGISTLTDGGPKRVLIHDADKGLIATDNFNATSPSWYTVNAGLTEAQYQGINKVIVTPGGQVYVAWRIENAFVGDPFIARAEAIGQPFVIIEDEASIAAKFPGYDNPYYGVAGIGVHPNQPDTVFYLVGAQVSSSPIARSYLGINGVFTEGEDTPLHVQGWKSISYGKGKWRMTSAPGFDPQMWIFTADATAIDDIIWMDSIYLEPHIPISDSGDTIHGYYDGGSVIEIGRNNGSSFDHPAGTEVYFTDDRGKLACDPTGMYMMADQGFTTRRGKSSDGGATWATPGASLPVVGAPYYVFAYAGGVGVASRWIAGQSVIKYSEDFGTNWIDKAGNIGDIVTIVPAVREIIVVES